MYRCIHNYCCLRYGRRRVTYSHWCCFCRRLSRKIPKKRIRTELEILRKFLTKKHKFPNSNQENGPPVGCFLEINCFEDKRYTWLHIVEGLSSKIDHFRLNTLKLLFKNKVFEHWSRPLHVLCREKIWTNIGALFF